MNGQHGAGRDAEAFLAHYFKRIDEDTASSFSPHQRAALVRMFATRWETPRHALDMRRSIGLGRRRFYFVLLAGRERRPSERLRRERRGGVLSGLVYLLLLGTFILAAMVGLYLIVKTALGIDTFEDGGFHHYMRSLREQLGLL